jgi:hypothetical protein
MAFHQVIGEKRGDYEFLIFLMLSEVFFFLGKADRSQLPIESMIDYYPLTKMDTQFYMYLLRNISWQINISSNAYITPLQKKKNT